MSMLKRQRELHKAEKAAMKRARRQGKPLEPSTEPKASVDPGTPADEAETRDVEEAVEKAD